MNKEKIKKWLKKDIRKFTLDEYYKVLAYLAGGTFIVVFTFLIASLVTFNLDNIVKLLVPFGVLLSAGLASVSVMKSIDNTSRIEREKEEKENEKVIKQLDAILSHLTIKICIIDQIENIEYLKSEKNSIEKISNNLFINEKIMSLNEEYISNILGIIENLIMNLHIAINLMNNQKKYIEELESNEKRFNESKKLLIETIELLENKYNLRNTSYSLQAMTKSDKLK